MNFSEVKLSSIEENKQSELIEICRKHEGGYIPGHHPDNTFCRTYHPNFIVAVKSLYQLYFDISKMACLAYYQLKTLPPFPEGECHHNAFSSLESLFKKHNITSCQGGNLAGQKLKYILGSTYNP